MGYDIAIYLCCVSNDYGLPRRLTRYAAFDLLLAGRVGSEGFFFDLFTGAGTFTLGRGKEMNIIDSRCSMVLPALVFTGIRKKVFSF